MSILFVQLKSAIGINPEDKILGIFNDRATHEDIAKKALLFDKLPITKDESILPEGISEESNHSDYQDEITFNNQVNPLGDEQNKDYED